MKRHLNIPLAVILAGVFIIAIRAQAATTQRVMATIPFTFNVGKTRLPAGRYTITVLNSTSDRKILQIRSANGRLNVMILTSAVIENASDNAKLVFHRYGDRYFFAQAQMAGDSMSLAAVMSKAERAEKQAVANSRKKSVVVITAE